MALIGYSSQTFAEGDDSSASKWSEDFRKLMMEVNVTTHEITTLLSLLSASIKNGQALPPYLKAPKPYGLSAKLEDMDSDILSVRHIAEPGYSAFAVVQISSRCVVGDLDKLLKYVFLMLIHVLINSSIINSDTCIQERERTCRRARFLFSYHQHDRLLRNGFNSLFAGLSKGYSQRHDEHRQWEGH